MHGVRIQVNDNHSFAVSNSNIIWKDTYVELQTANSLFNIGASTGDAPFFMQGGEINFSHATGGFISGSNSAWCIFEDVVLTGNAGAAGLIRAGSRASNYLFTGCDFTGFTAPTLVDMSTAADAGADIVFSMCSFPASLTVSDSVFANEAQKIRIVACDIDGASNAKRYKNELHTYRGTVTDNVTTYLDASTGHEDGSTKYSFEMVTGGNGTTVIAPWIPLESIELQAYISSTGSKTFTVEAVENFTSALDVDQAWMEVYYLGTANSTKYELGTTKGHLLTTALTAGTGLANWTGEPAGSRSVKFTKTLTVNETGVYAVKIFLGAYEAGKVLHYDSEVTVS
jgi:hypothetical protein